MARCCSPAAPRRWSPIRRSAGSTSARASSSDDARSSTIALGPRLALRQSQSLGMTPQLQQAIRLLALSNLEMEAVLSEELEKNPLLETAQEDAPEPVAIEEDSSEAAPAGDDFDDEPVTADRLIENGDSTGDAPLDVDYNEETF